MLMEWQQTFETGILEFDEHHKQLVDLLNMAHDGACYGAETDELDAVINELIKYTEYHFISEEYWMEEYNYPFLISHRQEHQEFTKTIVQFHNDFQQGKAHLSMEILTFLMEWFNTHILGSDAKYGAFFTTLKQNASVLP